MKAPVRLGITGSGFMGLTHAEAAALVHETKLVAVAGAGHRNSPPSTASTWNRTSLRWLAAPTSMPS